MNMHFTDILDIALQRQTNNEPLSVILADYPQQAATLAPLLKAAQALNAAQPVIMPAAEALQADRLQFLAQVEQTLPVPVSDGFLARLYKWTTHQFPWILSTNQRREPKRMNALMLKAAFVFTLLFGAMGGTAVLAQESLPDSPIYPVKLALEDARLAVNQDAAKKAVLHFSFAEERAQEMVAMAAAGQTPGDAIQARLETHINEALNLAAQQPDEAMFKLLTQAQNMVQTQLQNVTNAAARAEEPARKTLGEAAGFLNRAGREIEGGLKTPQTFRARYGSIPEGIVPQETGPCNTDDCQPAGNANQFGQHPDNEGHNGPGDGTCASEDCQPAGDRNQFGQDPDHEGQNGPGDGECAGEDCSQNCYQYGLDDLPLEPPHYQYQNRTGEGEGNGECNNGDCVPGGSEMNHGDGNNGDGNNGDGNNGDGNNGDGNGDGNNGDGNNGDGNNGGSGGNGGGGNGG